VKKLLEKGEELSCFVGDIRPSLLFSLQKKSFTDILDPLYDCCIKKKFEIKRSQKSQEYSSSGPPPEPL